MLTVVVLGCHRSGTSLVASLLQSFDFFMGSDLLEADEGNPKGYFEDHEFLDLNKSILNSLNGTWETKFTRRKIMSCDKLFGPKISKLVSKRNSQYERWGWKDPRTVQTIWLYHNHLRNPRYVVVRRYPGDIVESLVRLHKGDRVALKQLVAHYNQHIALFLKEIKPHYVEINYENLVNRSKSNNELLKIAHFLDVGSDVLAKESDIINYR